MLEILLVVAILGILAVAGTGFYRNFSKGVELESAAQSLVFELKNARAKSMAGENGLKWGIYFVNSENDYYEFFSTPLDYSSPSTTIKMSVFLPTTVIFSNPPEASTTEIIFGKITGNATPTAIIIESEGNSKAITITENGNVY